MGWAMEGRAMKVVRQGQREGGRVAGVSTLCPQRPAIVEPNPAPEESRCAGAHRLRANPRGHVEPSARRLLLTPTRAARPLRRSLSHAARARARNASKAASVFPSLQIERKPSTLAAYHSTCAHAVMNEVNEQGGKARRDLHESRRHRALPMGSTPIDFARSGH